MNRFHFRVLFLLACLFLGLARASAQDANSARDFLAKIYATYQGVYAPDLEQKGDNALFSLSTLQLKAESERALNGEMGYINFDPLCYCQDFDDFKVLAITVDMKPPTTAKAKVTFSNFGEPPKSVLFDLVWEKQKWRIHDLKPLESPHSFREMLKIDIRDFGKKKP
jgi:hypothetical protein